MRDNDRAGGYVFNSQCPVGSRHEPPFTRPVPPVLVEHMRPAPLVHGIPGLYTVRKSGRGVGSGRGACHFTGPRAASPYYGNGRIKIPAVEVLSSRGLSGIYILPEAFNTRPGSRV